MFWTLIEFPPMLVYSIPPHRLFFSQGRSGHRFSGVISKFSAWSILSADQNFCNPALALVCVPRWQQPAFSRSNSSIWSSTSLGHRFSGDVQSILRELYFVPFKCGVLALAMIARVASGIFASNHHNPSPLELLVQRLGHRFSGDFQVLFVAIFVPINTFENQPPLRFACFLSIKFVGPKFSADQIHGLLCGIRSHRRFFTSGDRKYKPFGVVSIYSA
jgi:hypothetical protein